MFLLRVCEHGVADAGAAFEGKIALDLIHLGAAADRVEFAGHGRKLVVPTWPFAVEMDFAPLVIVADIGLPEQRRLPVHVFGNTLCESLPRSEFPADGE